MPQDGFGRAHAQLLSCQTHSSANGPGLGDVVLLRAGPVSIDISNVGRRNFRGAHHLADEIREGITFEVQARDMMRCRQESSACDLGVDRRAAGLSMAESLED